MEDKAHLALLFLVSTLSQFPLSLVRFVAPIYALHLGGNQVVLGLMGFSYGLVYVASASYFGRFVERVGHGRMTATGLFLYAFVILTYIFVKDPFYLIFIRAGEAISMAFVWPSIEAFSKFSKNLKTSVFVYTLSWSVTGSLAPYVGALILKNFYVAFLLAFAVSLGSSAIALKMPKVSALKKDAIYVKSFDVVSDIILPIFVYGFNNAAIFTFYPAYGKILFGTYGAGIILSVSGLGLILSFLFSKYASISVNKAVFVGLSSQLLFILVFLFRSFFLQMLSLFILEFGQGMIYYFALLGIIDYFESGVGGKTGIFEASIGAGSAIGPLLSAIPTRFGLSLPWLFAFIESFVILILWILKKERKLTF